MSNTSQLQHVLIGCLVETNKVSNVSEVFRPLDLIFALNEVCSHDDRKIVLMTQLLTNCSVIKNYRSSVQCKCKPRGLLQLSSIASVPALKILGLNLIPQSCSAAFNSDDSNIAREVNSNNIFSCCGNVICGSEIDHYDNPGITIVGFAH